MPLAAFSDAGARRRAPRSDSPGGGQIVKLTPRFFFLLCAQRKTYLLADSVVRIYDRSTEPPFCRHGLDQPNFE
jgi:hypothetical protein